MSGKRLSAEERESILRAIRRKNRSFQSIAAEHSVSVSTVSRTASEAGLSSPRKRSSAVGAPEHSYDRTQRVAALDRMLHSIDKMFEVGGLSSRQIKDLASAAQSVFSTRRAEDIEPEEDEDDKAPRTVPVPELGDIRVPPALAREFEGIDRRLEEEER